MKLHACSVAILSLLASSASAVAQTTSTPLQVTSTSVEVPPVIQYSNVAADPDGNPLTGSVEMTFSLYLNAQGGQALWSETQTVALEGTGHYSVYIGVTKPNGVPMSLFSSGQAHWLGVRVVGQSEQPRVFLVSVPYAMKAGDAATIGGLPPSAFVLAAPPSDLAATANSNTAESSASGPLPAITSVTTSGGTANAISMFTTSTNIQNSILTQTGTTAINVGGKLNLLPTGTATTAGGKTSQPENFVASVFNSGTSKSVSQIFQFLAEPVNNNTTTASGTLNLRYGAGTATPTETGLKINSNGQITFAAGQVFPGTGEGSVTSVGSGAGLTGGPITSSGSLRIATAGVTNAMLADPSLTVAAGTDLTGGGAVALGGTTTLNLDTTKVPQLSTANTFTANQTVNGSLTTTGNIGTANITAVNITAGTLTATNSALAIFGQTTSTFEGTGVEGQTQGTSPNAFGVLGASTATSGTSIGVYGNASSAGGVGSFGQNGFESNVGTGLGATGAGVWGDGGTRGAIGVLGTGDSSSAGYFISNFSHGTTLFAENLGAGGTVFAAWGPDSLNCSIDTSGDLSCSGIVTGVVPLDGGRRKVALPAIESPQNWFEDAGSAQLVSGAAVVKLDPDFVQTVNTGMDYKVFPVPNGDCKGLYVTNKTATSFEVRELGSGTSSVNFDYRIMALRKNYESVRFHDQTNALQHLEEMEARKGSAHPQSHDPARGPLPVPERTLLSAPGTAAR